MNDSAGVPSWLAAGGFARAGDDRDWDVVAVAAAERDPVRFEALARVVARAAALSGGADPWGDLQIDVSTLSDAQRRELGA